MKHTKKLIATTMAMTLAMGSIPVFAETIEGDVNYVNTTIYKVTLPTTAGMSFILDPQGLTALDDTDDQTTTDTAKGGLIFKSGDTGLVAKNDSSVDVYLSAQFYLEDSADTDVIIVGKDGSLDDTQKQVQMYVTTEDQDGSAGSDIVVGSDNTATAGEFKMPAADYVFGGNATTGYTYELDEGSGSSLTMTLKGAVASEFDWSAYTGANAETLTLNAVFGFYEADADGDITTTPVTATQTATDDYVMTLNDDGTVSYTFVDAPEGTLTKIFVNDTERTGQITKSNITYADGVLTFNTSAVSVCTIDKSGNYTIVATIGSEEVTLTYTK